MNRPRDVAQKARRCILSRRWLPLDSLAIGLLATLFFAPFAYSATASWSLAPANYDFGSVQPASAEPAVPAVFTLTNTGEVDLSPPHVDLEYQMPEGMERGLFEIDRTDSDCESRVSLAVGDTCHVEVAFRPLYPGPRSGTISFIDPSAQVPPTTATFEGTGIGPIVSFSPSYFWLGSYLLGAGKTPPKVLTLSNTGNTDLTIRAISLRGLGANPNQVTIVGGTCTAGGIVAPNGSCTIQAAFTPTQAGEFTGELRVEDNARDGFQEVSLAWQGVVFAPEPAPARFVRIMGRPPPTMTRRLARFRFLVSGGGVQFVCRLDLGSYRPCRSPTTYRHLELGVHVFHVRPRFHTPGLWSGAAAARFRILPKKKAN
jgi:hypothetical protein